MADKFALLGLYINKGDEQDLQYGQKSSDVVYAAHHDSMGSLACQNVFPHLVWQLL